MNVEDLLRLAGERDMPSRDSMERARTAAHASWQRTLEKPTPGRWRWALAASAAALLLAVLAMWSYTRAPGSTPAVVASVSRLQGAASLRAADGSGQAVRVGMKIPAGAELVAGDARVALTLGDALSLRLDRNTRVRFLAEDLVELREGSVYVDPGGFNLPPSLRIRTPFGTVAHVGTQYLVTVSGGETRVRVREGRVIITPTDLTVGSIGMTAGEELRAVGRTVTQLRGLPSSGPEWDWSASIGAPFDIEGRPLSEFVAWLAREHGWQIRYVDQATQQHAQEIRLHGAASGSDARAIERVALITGVPLTEHEGVLLVGDGPAP